MGPDGASHREEEKEQSKQMTLAKQETLKTAVVVIEGDITQSALMDVIDENNLLHQMWKRAVVDQAQYDNYEKWLEEEVWSYYD